MMRLMKTTFTLLMACWCVNALAAEDGVIIDLSVLDGLNNAYSAPAEPMFPVMPKATPKAKVQLPKVKNNGQKSVAKAAEPNVIVFKKDNVIPDSNEKVEVVDVEPVLPQADLQQLNDFAHNQKDAADSKINDQPKLQVEEVVVPTDEVKIELPESVKVSDTDNEKTETSNPINIDSALVSDDEKIIKEEIANEVKEQKESLLVAAPKVANKPHNAIIFAEDVDELSNEQMSEIDNIVSSYKNEKNNKVAIYSYNADNGVDSFRKKRVSLNRAIEIRSYLLKKGFKNFSIKVVNIAEDSSKANMVEISEI